ncbi:MAG: hypothetical protein V2A74_14955 [bacterium]
MEFFGQVVRAAVERKAASFHLNVGLPPILRVSKRLEPVEGLSPASRDHLMELVSWLLDDEQRREMNKKGEVTRTYAPSFAPSEVFDVTFLWSAGEPTIIGNYYTVKFEGTASRGAKGEQPSELGRILEETGLINNERILEAIRDSGESAQKLKDSLINSGLVSEKEILDAIAKQMGIKRVDLDDIEVTQELLDQIPKDSVFKYRIFPVGHSESEVKIALHDPTMISVTDHLEKKLGKAIIGHITSEEQIDSYIRRYYGENDYQTE